MFFKKSKKKKKNKVKVVKSSKKKTYGLSEEEMCTLCNNLKLREDKIVVLNTYYKY